MNKILITGSHGQVAYEVAQLLQQRGQAYLALPRDLLNIADQAVVNAVMNEYRPSVVINTAAYTKVDLAEKEIQQAYAVNFEGPKHLAMACAELGSQLVHLSTDYIFDGCQAEPYRETSAAIPLSVYGASKRYGEVAVQECNQQAMILRVSGVFGVHGHNFVKTILRLAKANETLRIVADQTLCPTPAKAIAETILQMIATPNSGIYHYCGANPTTWHAFAKRIVDVAKAHNQPLTVKQIEAITTAQYPVAARRPQYSVLDCQKIKDTFHISQPSWEQGLDDVISQLSAT